MRVCHDGKLFTAADVKWTFDNVWKMIQHFGLKAVGE
jgi:ABC-type transport system substrate-binding protein